MTEKKTGNLVIFSPTGTSGQIGHNLAKNLWQDNYNTFDLTLSEQFVQPLRQIGLSGPTIFVVPVYAGRVAPLAVERMQHLRGSGVTPAIIIVVYGNRAFEDALLELSDLVTEWGFVPIAAAACIGEHSYSRVGREIAPGRPDHNDMIKMAGFAQKVLEKLVSEEIEQITVPGNSEYRDGVGPADFHPQFIKKGCTLCGVCVASCPAGIISLEDDQISWEDGCIRCCACIKNCPENVLDITEPRVVELCKMLVQKCADRREAEFFT